MPVRIGKHSDGDIRTYVPFACNAFTSLTTTSTRRRTWSSVVDLSARPQTASVGGPSTENTPRKRTPIGDHGHAQRQRRVHTNTGSLVPRLVQTHAVHETSMHHDVPISVRVTKAYRPTATSSGTSVCRPTTAPVPACGGVKPALLERQQGASHLHSQGGQRKATLGLRCSGQKIPVQKGLKRVS